MGKRKISGGWWREWMQIRWFEALHPSELDGAPIATFPAPARAYNRIVTILEETMKTNNSRQTPTLHVLFVDDDPLYRHQMTAAAAARGIAVTTCGSWRELQAMAMPDVFDLAIVDYYLDGVHRALTAPAVAARLKNTPALFISGDPNCISEGEAWPSSVRHFISKEAGIKAILDTALRIKGLSS